jgi:outer membrane lipoprotein-sorting protein
MRRIALSALAIALAGSAWAGPKETVHDAFAKFLAAKSFRATVTDVKNGEQLSQMEFVAPNRYHMHNAKAGMDTIIVGDDAWMNMHGQLTKMPIPVGKIIGQYRNESALRQMESGITVTDLGADSVDGEPAHAYHYTVTEPANADVKLWIGDKTGLPLQMESQGSFMGHASTARIRYSNFNDPAIAIAAP